MLTGKVKGVAVVAALAMSFSLCGCTAASVASQQASQAAENFEVVRELTEKEKESILANAALYLEKSKEYRAHAAKQA